MINKWINNHNTIYDPILIDSWIKKTLEISPQDCHESWLLLTKLYDSNQCHKLMDNPSERGNHHLLKAITLKLKLLSSDKWQDRLAHGKAFAFQLVFHSQWVPPVVRVICRVKRPAGFRDVPVNLCQLQSPHKSLRPPFEVRVSREKSNRWSLHGDRQIHRGLFFSWQETRAHRWGEKMR